MTSHPLLIPILLLGAALLAATPSEAHPALLPEGSRPPVFTLPDGAGSPVSLRSFLGLRRVVLLFGPSVPYLKTVKSESAQFEDRDLTVLAVGPHGASQAPGTATGPVHLLTDADGKVAQRYGAPGETAAFYLIGKDGHIAVARHGYPSPRELFGIIDAMPMRRQEMRDRRR